MLQARFLLIGALLPLAGAHPQSPLFGNRDANQDRASAVVEAFRFSWDGYYTHAFPHDELHPVTNTFSDSRNGWGASAVDALTTAIIMQQSDVVDQILAFIPTIDFSRTWTTVSLFETTIRYLSSMISSYELLKGPFAGLPTNSTNVDALLDQAQRLADVLKYAFDTPSGVPSNNLNIEDGSTDGATTNGLATAGTLVTQRAESFIIDPHPPWNEPWPGLLGTDIDLQTGQFTDASGGWIGGEDSAYEYLIKMYVFSPSRFGKYRDRWVLAADSTMAHLASHPASRPDITFVAAYNNQTLNLTSQHLACFGGGNFILGGTGLNVWKYIDFGMAWVDGCHDTYASDATGIGPEQWSWDSNVPAAQDGFYNTSGFYITSNGATYDLRPEVIESYYYAYRATGDSKYQDWAWDAFVAINATCRVGSGFSEIKNVNVAGGGGGGGSGFTDFQESFWFAEVMKYAFMIHAPDAEWQVAGDGQNKWVFNTEAHPVRTT